MKGDMGDQSRSVALQSRQIPFPSSISPEARANLERLGGADGVPLNALHTRPLPQEDAAWVTRQTAVDVQGAGSVEARSGTLRSRGETVRVGDAALHVATPEIVLKGDCVLLDFHGRALVFGGGEECRAA